MHIRRSLRTDRSFPYSLQSIYYWTGTCRNDRSDLYFRWWSGGRNLSLLPARYRNWALYRNGCFLHPLRHIDCAYAWTRCVAVRLTNRCRSLLRFLLNGHSVNYPGVPGWWHCWICPCIHRRVSRIAIFHGHSSNYNPKDRLFRSWHYRYKTTAIFRLWEVLSRSPQHHWQHVSRKSL